MDAVQLEENEVPSVFHEEYGRTAQHIAIIAPDYLECAGGEPDHPICDNYAPVCLATEVGCKAAAPSNGNDSSGIVNETDSARLNASAMKHTVSLKRISRRTLFRFISSPTPRKHARRTCGVRRITNIDSLAEGGRVAFIFHFAPSMSGSRARGFKRRFFNLLHLGRVRTQPAISLNMDFENPPSAAPCVSYARHLEIVPKPERILLWECDAHDDIVTNPDCREFFDDQGAVHYRLYSNDFGNNDCNAYRKLFNAADCSTTGGVWNGARNCTYFALPSESQMPCGAERLPRLCWKRRK